MRPASASTQFKMNDLRQGIVHVIGPEQGATLPGMTVVCGDSHTSTHGAFGALAHGIGTSEVEHVLATQTLLATKAKNMLVEVEGKLPRGFTAKDIVLAIIGTIGTAGGTGYTIEFAGRAIRALSMEGRMTVCNMAIEAGARAGLVGVDETTIAYVKGRPYSPDGRRVGRGRRATGARCSSDAGRAVRRGRRARRRRRSCRRSPGARRPRWWLSIDDRVPDPDAREGRRQARRDRARAHVHGPGAEQADRPTSASTRSSSARAPTRASRTCARPRRWCAASAAGSPANVKLAMVVPGSGLVKEQAEREGLRRDLQGRRLRVARARLLDVPGDERRPARAGRALRLDHQPQFRRPPGRRRPHPPGEPGDGGGGRDRRPFRRRPPA